MLLKILSIDRKRYLVVAKTKDEFVEKGEYALLYLYVSH